MNDEEIIKALECCSVRGNCDGCPCDKEWGKSCISIGMKNALELINRQKAEIERLRSLVDDSVWDFCSISGCEGASNDCWKTCPDSRYNKIKAEAERILNQKIVNQSKEIKRLLKCLFDVTNSRDHWKAKACRVGKQLQQVLEDKRKEDNEKEDLTYLLCVGMK